jgi:hypothetical protein
MALTEIPATAAYSLHLAALLSTFHGSGCARILFLKIFIAGVALGLAILGRQPLVLSILPLTLLACVCRKERAACLAIISLSLAVCAPVFLVWGGLVPPKTAFVGQGIKVSHGIAMAGYAALILSVLSPRFMILNWRWIAASITGGLIINSIWDIGSFLPLNTVAEKVIPHGYAPACGKFCFGVLAGIALWLSSSLVRNTFVMRHDALFLAILLSISLQVVATAGVTHATSSRYLMTSLPLFLLAASRIPTSEFAFARLSLGAFVGCVSLTNYLCRALG